MSMQRQIVASLLFAISGLLSVAGCGSDASSNITTKEPSTAQDGGEPGEPVRDAGSSAVADASTGGGGNARSDAGVHPPGGAGGRDGSPGAPGDAGVKPPSGGGGGAGDAGPKPPTADGGAGDAGVNPPADGGAADAGADAGVISPDGGRPDAGATADAGMEHDGGAVSGADFRLVGDERYGDFLFQAFARSNQSLGVEGGASFSIAYGWVDAQSYSAMVFSSRLDQTRLIRVRDGVTETVAQAPRAGIVDNGVHRIDLWRHGPWIRVQIDGIELLSVNESDPVVGAVGVGPTDESVTFDEIRVTPYRDVRTPHYRLTYPNDLRRYEDSVESILEIAYVVYAENTGWDVNQRLGNDYYSYLYRPSGWIWFNDAHGCCVLGGGLTVSGGPSAVTAELIPQSKLQASASPNTFVAVTLHELGNGWFLPGATQPEWVEWLRSESHSGFLRAEGELDMGYCADANREHAAHYADYVATSLDDRRLRGLAVEPLLISLRERYGWGVFRALYDATLSGELDYLSTLGSDARDNEMVLFLSRQVGENLSGVLTRELGIRVSDEVSAALDDLPDSDLVVLSTLPCHAPRLRATPSSVTLTATENERTPSSVLYVQAPLAWTVTAPAVGWLTVERTDTSQATTLIVRANSAGIPAGSTRTAEIVLSGDGLAGGPLRIPVTLSTR